MANETIAIDQLIEDDKNFNKGTEKGLILMNSSFENFGAARSVLIDKNNKIIAGNKSALIAKTHGIDKVRIIETTGDELVAVKRTDIDLDSTKGRELALADNMTAKENINLDYNEIQRCVEEVKIDTAAWGIKDLDKLIAEQEKQHAAVEREQKSKALDSYNACQNMGKTPIRFSYISIDPTQEEYDRLCHFAEDYYERNGVVVGMISELLGL